MLEDKVMRWGFERGPQRLTRHCVVAEEQAGERRGISFRRDWDLFENLRNLAHASWRWVEIGGTRRSGEAKAIGVYWREDGETRIGQIGGGPPEQKPEQKSES